MKVDAAIDRYVKPISTADWQPFGTGDGFSGARIWKGTTADGRTFALKARPLVADLDRFRAIHARLAMADLPFVPTLAANGDGETITIVDETVFDIQDWKGGTAVADIGRQQLAAAMVALRQLHIAWEPESQRGPAPYIGRRIAALETWRSEVIENDPIRIRAHAMIASRRSKLLLALRQLEADPVRLQPIHGDLWHSHVLFSGNAVTGLIDFDAVRIDAPEADLARLLGDWFGVNQLMLAEALVAYGPGIDPERLHIAIEAGLLTSVAHWCTKLRTNPLVPKIEHRLLDLLRRLDPSSQ